VTNSEAGTAACDTETIEYGSPLNADRSYPGRRVARLASGVVVLTSAVNFWPELPMKTSEDSGTMSGSEAWKPVR
jgi:hypothetical protein